MNAHQRRKWRRSLKLETNGYDYYAIATTSSAHSVQLPPMPAGQSVTVTNKSAHPLTVYPARGNSEVLRSGEIKEFKS